MDGTVDLADDQEEDGAGVEDMLDDLFFPTVRKLESSDSLHKLVAIPSDRSCL